MPDLVVDTATLRAQAASARVISTDLARVGVRGHDHFMATGHARLAVALDAAQEHNAVLSSRLGSSLEQLASALEAIDTGFADVDLALARAGGHS